MAKVHLVGLALKPQPVGVPDVYRIGAAPMHGDTPVGDGVVSKISIRRLGYSNGVFGDGQAYVVEFEESSGRHVVFRDSVSQFMVRVDEPDMEAIGEIPD